MTFHYLQILNPVISLMANILLQVFTFRCWPYFKLMNSIMLGFLIGFTNLAVVEMFIFLVAPTTMKYDFIATVAANSITYSSCAYCYFHFINLGETARRVRILRELYDSLNGLSFDELLKRYNAKVIFENRIARLLNASQITTKNHRFYIRSPIMLFIASSIILLKLILFGKKQIG